MEVLVVLEEDDDGSDVVVVVETAEAALSFSFLMVSSPCISIFYRWIIGNMRLRISWSILFLKDICV